MTPTEIDGSTRTLGKSQGYIGLPILDYKSQCSIEGDTVEIMMSEWEMSDEERELIAGGASVFLHVIGKRHPPVSISVSHPSTPNIAGDQL